MIKLFRNIRQKLITEGKTANYLKYAIGEIVLVVIGILIALQVNNINENKKQTKQGNEAMILLKEELNQNVDHFNRVIKSNKTIIGKANNFLKNPNAYADSTELGSLFNYSPLEIHQSMLNKILETTNEAILKQDQLLKKLRMLKDAYNGTEKQLYYLDEFWNTNTAHFLITSGLGFDNNMRSAESNFELEYKPYHTFNTILKMETSLVNDFTRKVEKTLKMSNEIMKSLENLDLYD